MIHNIRFRVIVSEDESIEELTQAILNVLPEAIIDSEDAEGILGNKITILSGLVSKKRFTKEFFNSLKELDNSTLEKLVLDLDKKVDDSGNLFLRLSKEDAILDKWTILDSGDCIHLKVKIAAFPAKKEVAISKIKEEIVII